MGETNSDLLREREHATFNPEDVTIQLYGKAEMEVLRLAYKRAAEDPEFKIAEKFPTMPRDEVYNEATRMYSVLARKQLDYGYTPRTFGQRAYVTAAFLDAHPFGVHNSMFIPTIQGQGTDEQISEFMPKADSHEFIGTYAQTELGHGTFVRGLETTATYDKRTEEFILHSPTITSIKYWPGGLGRTSNYAVVMAQLIIDGKNHGVNAFMCQLRDLDTHEPLPGIELGDINQKFDYNIVDNGYLKMTQFRIPRTNMLMRYAQVSPDGRFIRRAIPQATYLTMTYVRMGIVSVVGIDLAMAATIATRYSAVRRQTANSKGIEPQILDYQTQQMKLFPAISTSYAIYFTGSLVKDIYADIMAAVKAGDTSRLPEIHCLTSGLKAFTTEICCELIEVCRRSCGGHGYSHASGIPKIYGRTAPACTFEGENTVMYLQCARSLLKFLRKAQTGETVPPAMQFLANSPGYLPSELQSAKAFSFELYVTALKLNALRSITNLASKLANASVDPETAWNSNSFGLANAAKMYAVYLTAMYFVDSLLKPDWEPRAKQAMSAVCEFYLVHSILVNSGTFLQNQVLSSRQTRELEIRRTELLKELRPNAVALVDSFDNPDRVLNSCLGRYDGNVYEALYEYAKSSSLNKHQVHPSYHKYVKPMQQALKAKL